MAGVTSDDYTESRIDVSTTCHWRIATGATATTVVPWRTAGRRTEHSRRWRRGDGWTVETVERGSHDDDRATARLRADFDAVYPSLHATVSDHPGLNVGVRATVLSRDCENSDGTRLAVSTDGWAVTVVLGEGEAARRSVASAPDLAAQVADLLDPRVRLDGREPAGLADLPTGPTVLLQPTVAGMLLHELIGHAAEEGHIGAGDRVLPPGVQVIAEPTRCGVDDEGVPAGPLVLIDDGVVQTTIADRVRAPARGTEPSGYARCGAHAPQPQPRLTHLRIAAPRSTALPGRYVRCLSATGARYFHGSAVVDVSRAEVESGDPVRPFRLVVERADLLRATVAGAARAGTGTGFCIKDGDELPSAVRCGPVVLAGARCWTAP